MNPILALLAAILAAQAMATATAAENPNPLGQRLDSTGNETVGTVATWLPFIALLIMLGLVVATLGLRIFG